MSLALGAISISRSKGVGYALLATLALAVAVRGYRNPFPTFDRLLYAATVAHLHTSDPRLVAQEALRLAGNSDYPHSAFTDQLLSQPTLLDEQVPFYAIRPIYVWALSVTGLRMVSPLAYLGVVLVLTLWIGNPWWVMPMALLPDLLSVAREITPDALTCFVVLGGFLLLRRSHLAAGLALLMLSLGVRTDSLFFLIPVLAVLTFRGMLDWRIALGCALFGSVVVSVIDHLAHNYGWTVLLRHSFSGGLIHPALANAPISPHDYLGYLVHGITGVLSICSLWVLLGVIVWRYSRASRDFLLVTAAFCVIHIIVFPISDPRYFVTAFLLVCVLLVETFANTLELRNVSPLQPSLDRSQAKPRGAPVLTTFAAQKRD